MPELRSFPNGQRTALIVAAHGDRGEDRSNAQVKAHVERVAAAGVFDFVSAGFLKGDPSITEAVRQGAAVAERILIYPLFMSDGYFTNTLLPRQIDEAEVKIPIERLTPLGFDPQLPVVCERLAQTEATTSNLAAAGCRLLIVGHGSRKSPASKNATDAFAARLAERTAFAAVETCFLEEPPLLRATLEDRHRPSIIVGYFAGEGLHGGEDVPEILAETGAEGAYAGALGARPEVAELILQAVGRHLAAESSAAVTQ